MNLILLCAWAEQAVLGNAKTAIEIKYEIERGSNLHNSMYVACYKLEK